MNWKGSFSEKNRYFETENGILYHGDALSVLKTLPDNSVDCIVTSPPYWQKRDYSVEGQLGLESTPKEFVDRLIEVFKEAKRVLKPYGNLFVNIDDTWTGGGHGDDTLKYAGRVNLPKVSWSAEGMPKKKSLALVPELFVVKMVYDEGWILREKVIWSKKVFFYKENKTKGNAMPESVKDRLAHSWEYIYHFTKRQKYYFDLSSLRIKPEYSSDTQQFPRRKELIGEKKGNSNLITMPSSTRNSKYLNGGQNTRSPGGRLVKILASGNADKVSLVKKAVSDVNGYLKKKLKEKGLTVKKLSSVVNIPESQLAHYFRTDLSGASLPSRDVWILLEPMLGLGSYDDYIKEEYKSIIPTNNPDGAKPSDVVQINVKGFPDAHFAVFPEEIPRILITIGCPKDGVVFDPFAGAGTTLFVAEKSGRNWVGIELNPEYCGIIQDRLQPLLRRRRLI